MSYLARAGLLVMVASTLLLARDSRALPVELRWTAYSYATLNDQAFIPYWMNSTTLTVSFHGDTDDIEAFTDAYTGKHRFTLRGVADFATPELGTSRVLADAIVSVGEGVYASAWLGLGIEYSDGSGKLLFRMQDQSFHDYSLNSDFGPIYGDIDSVSQFNNVPLTLGDFDVLSFFSVRFAATVPEPSLAVIVACTLFTLALGSRAGRRHGSH